MSLTFDTATRSLLNGKVTKLQWADGFEAALGSTRRIRCFHDANAAASNPFLTGTEFRNVGSTGAMTKVAGKITKLGRIKGTTVSLAASMSSGVSIVRIQNADGTRWVQGTLGLSVAAQVAKGVLEANAVQYDFTVNGDFTATNGLGITPNFNLAGYRFLPSGTGPVAPALDANAPHTFEVWNWTDPANPTLSGTTTLDRRDDDFVYEDADMAAENGDVAVYQTSIGVMHGTGDVHEFGFTLLASHTGNTEIGTMPLYEVIGAAAVRGTWTTYPQSDTHDPTQHTTYPAPFKVVMKNAAGTVLYTWQMRDGLAINAQPIEAGVRSTTIPVRPFWNCGMQLPWENTRQKVSSKANKWYAGMVDGAKRPSRGKRHYTVNGVEPMLTGGYQGNSRNGLHNLYATEQWPRAYKDRPTVTPGDPFGPPEYYQNDGSADSAPWCDGWDWEPGSFSNHNWYTGPGGPRFDRAPIPSIYALWMSDPNGARLQGSVPWKDMGRAFTKAYHNHSNHYVSNPNTLQLARNNDELMNQWGLAKTYYDGHPIMGAKIINVASDMRDGENASHYDKLGRYIWSGWGRDPLHSYGNAGWAALLSNAPSKAIAAKWDVFFQRALGGPVLGRGDYMVRSQAWRWLNYTLGWKLASSHRLGISRAQMEQMFITELEGIYRDIYVPVFVNNEDSIFANGIRNLGVPIKHEDNFAGVTTQGGGLGFYMAGVLALMKQTGLWSVLYAKGGHVKTVLDMQLRNMDKYCFDKILDTPSTQYGGGGYQGWADTDPVPASWTEYTTKYENFNGQMGLFHNADGSVAGDRDVSVHPMAMYPYIRRDYFPEFPHARLAAAIAKYDAEFGAVADYVAAAVDDPQSQRDRDHTYGYPGVAVIKAPTELGPA